MKAVTGAVAAALVALLGVPILILLLLGGGASAATATTVAAAACQYMATPTASPVAGLDAAALDVARVIAATGDERGLGRQAEEIALDVAIARTHLHPVVNGLGAGVGVFAMTPGGFVTADQLANPATAAGLFYDRLEKVDGWKGLAPVAAAKAALPELLPGSYADAWPPAQKLAAELATGVHGAVDPVTSCGPVAVASGMTSDQVAVILDFARAQVGDAYLTGADGPDAWDCSGLTQAAFARIGVHIPPVSDEQYEWFRNHALVIPGPVSPSQLQPGDLLFSRGAHPHTADDGQRIGHVSIYAGDGVVVQAKGEAWGIVESSYSSSEWDFVEWVGRLPAPSPTPTPVPSSSVAPSSSQ